MSGGINTNSYPAFPLTTQSGVLNNYFFGPRKGISLIDRKKDHAKSNKNIMEKGLPTGP